MSAPGRQGATGTQSPLSSGHLETLKLYRDAVPVVCYSGNILPNASNLFPRQQPYILHQMVGSGSDCPGALQIQVDLRKAAGPCRRAPDRRGPSISQEREKGRERRQSREGADVEARPGQGLANTHQRR